MSKRKQDLKGDTKKILPLSLKGEMSNTEEVRGEKWTQKDGKKIRWKKVLEEGKVNAEETKDGGGDRGKKGSGRETARSKEGERG